MKKIKSREELLDAIDAEYTWRLHEIVTMKGELDRVKNKDKVLKPMSRSLVVLSYSHWEGFVKYSSTYFYEYISSLGLNKSQLSNRFLASSIRHLCDQRKMYDAVGEILNCLNDPSYKFTYNDEVLTSAESNLNYEVLSKISANIGNDISTLAYKHQLLDAKILERRNRCAHGDNVFTDYNYGAEVAQEVISLMKLYKTSLQNYIATKGYLL